MRTLENGMAVLHPLYCPHLASLLFSKLQLALKGRRCGDKSIIQEQSLVCSPKAEKTAYIFIRDRALKECPLCRSQCGCWSATSIETSVLWCDVHAFRMQLDMVTTQGAFLYNVGASEALLQLPEHVKLNPLLCGWASPMLETRIRGDCLVGDRGAEPALQYVAADNEVANLVPKWVWHVICGTRTCTEWSGRL